MSTLDHTVKAEQLLSRAASHALLLKSGHCHVTASINSAPVTYWACDIKWMVSGQQTIRWRNMRKCSGEIVLKRWREQDLLVKMLGWSISFRPKSTLKRLHSQKLIWGGGGRRYGSLS